MNTNPLPQHVDIAIVGAGFSGLGMAIKLKQSGREDFVVLERAEEIGGTWEANTYPGCQCDIPSNLYSFSFAPNPNWTNTFALQPEIWDYLRRVTVEFGVGPHLRLGCGVSTAGWDEERGLWRIETSRGTLTSRFLISGVGLLCEPSIPDLPGLETFEGAAFHTARWDREHDLRGRRVAVVGTGASAVQVVPRIQPEVGHLTLFQRTPPWILPHLGRGTRPRERRLFELFPQIQRAVRASDYWTREALVPIIFRRGLARGIGERVGRRHIEDQVADPALREQLTPDYEIGCKRILFSDTFYPALQQPNVELIGEGVTEVRPRSLLTADGREHEIDTIVWGTGFHASEMPFADLVHGRGGRNLGELWTERGMRALRGTTVAGFPNLFMLVGPNTGLGHNSLIFMIESQIAYVLEALRTMDGRSASVVEPREDAQDRFNESIQAELERMVWSAGGCASWYLDRHGHNRTLWPGTSWSFRRATRSFDPSEYALS